MSKEKVDREVGVYQANWECPELDCDEGGICYSEEGTTLQASAEAISRAVEEGMKHQQTVHKNFGARSAVRIFKVRKRS